MKSMWGLLICLLSVQVQGLAEAARVARDTDVLIRIKNSVSSRTADQGDAVLAEVMLDLAEDGQVLVPKGTIVVGRVVRAHRAGRLHGSGQLGLSFSELVFSDGRKVPFKTSDESADEYRTRQDGTLVADSQALRQVAEGAHGATQGALVGLTGGLVTGRWRSLQWMGRGGLVGGMVVGLLHRGGEVTLPAGTAIMLRLSEPLDLSPIEATLASR